MRGPQRSMDHLDLPIDRRRIVALQHQTWPPLPGCVRNHRGSDCRREHL